jgi:hypothetical protein
MSQTERINRMNEPTSVRYKNENKIHVFIDDTVNGDGMHTRCGKKILGNGKWRIGNWQITCKKCLSENKQKYPLTPDNADWWSK